MALQPCRECGRMVSTEAEFCPQCGVPTPTKVATPVPVADPAMGSFTSQNLSTGEQMVYRAHVHPVVFGWAFLLTLLWLVTVWGVQELSTLKWIFFGLALVAWIVGLVIKRSTEFVITNKRVTTKTGIIQRNSLETLLEKVETVGVHQDLLGRILGYGNVTVIGTGGSRELFKTIARPLTLRRVLHDQIEKSKSHDHG